MGFKVQIQGLDNAFQKIEGLGTATKKEIQAELNAFGEGTAQQAKQIVASNSSDEGHLLRSINSKPGNLEVSVVVSADYAAYVEFGTKKFAAAHVASLPPDWQAYAAQFKGKGGGSFDEFVQRLVKWVLRKKIGATYDIKTRRRVKVGKQSARTTAEADAYAIALHIIRHGSKAHPFLYPAYRDNSKKLVERLKNRFK